MKITGIYVKSTNEILFSRTRHDMRYSENGVNYIDGGNEYCRVGFVERDEVVILELDSDVILNQILYYDWNCQRMDDKPEGGYHGRYKITDSSNLDFFERLVINWEDIEDLI